MGTCGPVGRLQCGEAEQWSSRDKLSSGDLSWKLASALPSCVILDSSLPSLSLSVLICQEAVRCLAEDLSC